MRGEAVPDAGELAHDEGGQRRVRGPVHMNKGAAKLAGSPNARPATDSFVRLANAYRDLEGVVAERFGSV